MGWYEIKNLFLNPVTMDFDKASPINQVARGIPVLISNKPCNTCKKCSDICPTGVIKIESDKMMSFDYGKCVQCGLCSSVCPEEKIEDSGLVYVFALNREELKVTYKNGNFEPTEFPVSENVKKFRELTGERGFNYREVAAAGNNSVECELNASFNNVFDSEGQQIRSVASPKHADAIIYSGPISENMRTPLGIAWDCMPEPKALIAAGTEAVSGGLFPPGKQPKEPDLFIGGDPPRPDVMINGCRFLMGKLKYSFQNALKKRQSELLKKEDLK